MPLEYLSHKEKYEEAVRKSTIGFKKIRELRSLGKDGIDNYMALLSGMLGSGLTPDGNPFSLHYVMFLPTLMGQGTPDQQAEWMGRAWACNIIGTYAQTELGHGTFIRGLETTATYDPKTEEFVLNSPTLTSFKWWPGGCKNFDRISIEVFFFINFPLFSKWLTRLIMLWLWLSSIQRVRTKGFSPSSFNFVTRRLICRCQE